MNDLERFVTKVQFTDECWLWTGAWCGPERARYWQFTKRSKQVRAHRASYELFVGSIPSGLVIDHLCRIPLCVNPDHLEPVTPSVNAKRGISGQPRQRCAHSAEFFYMTNRGIRSCRECRRGREARKREGRREAKTLQMDYGKLKQEAGQRPCRSASHLTAGV